MEENNMKATGKITTTLILIITVSLFLTSCSGIVPPGLQPNLENQENTEEPVIENTEESGTVYPQKWSGLGMIMWSTENTSEFDGYVDTLLANGFKELRIDIPDILWIDPLWVVQSKAAVIRAIAKGANVIWGVNTGEITSDSWATFRLASLDAAQWAQDNGVYEFQLGNEQESQVDGTTITGTQLIANLKSLATEVQAIFTRGNISYSYAWGYLGDWIAAGKGDIDIIAGNIYMGANGSYGDGWKNDITKLVNAFGVDGTYLTEFGPSVTSLDDYSTDEAVQAEAVTEMIEYIKASGMKRANFFCYYDDSRPFFGLVGCGVLKTDGTYRLLWNQALLNSIQGL